MSTTMTTTTTEEHSNISEPTLITSSSYVGCCWLNYCEDARQREHNNVKRAMIFHIFLPCFVYVPDDNNTENAEKCERLTNVNLLLGTIFIYS